MAFHVVFWYIFVCDKILCRALTESIAECTCGVTCSCDASVSGTVSSAKKVLGVFGFASVSTCEFTGCVYFPNSVIELRVPGGSLYLRHCVPVRLL